MENEAFLKELLDAVTVSGAISLGSQAVKREMEGCADEVITDILDDTIAVLNPQAEKKILVTAHLDEIGLVITTADENGYLYAIDRGGVIPQTYPGHRVQIHTEKGIVKGVVNGARELCRKEKLEVTDLAIDIGASSKKEALELVRPGDTVTFDAGFEKLSGGRFAGRALDDRLGVFIIMEAFKRAKAAGAKNGLYCGRGDDEKRRLLYCGKGEAGSGHCGGCYLLYGLSLWIYRKGCRSGKARRRSGAVPQPDRSGVS